MILLYYSYCFTVPRLDVPVIDTRTPRLAYQMSNTYEDGRLEDSFAPTRYILGTLLQAVCVSDVRTPVAPVV